MPSRVLFWIVGLLMISLIPALGFSQGKRIPDVVYLKNNWVLRGTIILNTSDSLKIQTNGGNEFAFSKDQIILVKKEKEPIYYQNTKRGFSNYTELGPLASRNTSNINVNTSAFSFQSVTGYTFSPLLFLGVGAGIDLYATQTFVPLFGSVRGEIRTQGPINPYYFLDIGNGFDITSYTNNTNFGKGGFLLGIGGGIKINFNRASGFLISLGYRLQNISTTTMNVDPLTRYDPMITRSQYNRIALRAGFYF